MTHYLHFAPQRLRPGSIIEPGNFGRMLKRYRVAVDNLWLLARELVFEQVRIETRPDLPSRMNCSFGLLNEEDAKLYRHRNDPNFQQFLHEVQLVDQSAAVHVAGLSFLELTQHEVFLDPYRLKATRYWSGEFGDPSFGKEAITKSAWLVVACRE